MLWAVLIAKVIFSVSVYAFGEVHSLRLSEGSCISLGYTEGLLRQDHDYVVALTPVTRVLSVVLSLAQNLPMLVGIYTLIQIFHNFKMNNVFIHKNMNGCRLISKLFILDAIFVHPLMEVLNSIVHTWARGEGARVMRVSFGTPNIEKLMCGLIALAVFYVMSEALKIKQEQEMVI